VELRLLTEADYVEELDITADELVNQYLAGSLSEDEAHSFEQNFLATPERRQKLRFARTLQGYIEEEKSAASPKLPEQMHGGPIRTRWFFSPMVIAASVLLVIGLAFGIWWGFFYQSEVAKGMVALNDAYRSARPVEARISGLNYAPLPNVRGESNERVDAETRDLAGRLLLEAARNDPGPHSRQALGRFYLANHEYDKAINQFDQSLQAIPADAQLHSDLGAAYLERGKAEMSDKESGKSLVDFGKSIEEISKALDLDGSLLEALYNRALCHQYMPLPQQAADDWRQYLVKDSTSQWAEEARRNLKALEEKNNDHSEKQQGALENFIRAYRAGDDEAAWRLYTRGHKSSGNAITEALLNSCLGQSDEAKESCRALTYLGQLELRRANDAYTSDMSKLYASASSQERSVLSQARTEIRQGYELFTHSKITEAMEWFTRARARFEQLGDTGEALSADYAIAHGAAVQPDIKRGLEIFARITPICEGKNYRWLLAQCLSERAHIQLNLNNYSEAIDDGSRAMHLSEEVQDWNGMCGSLLQIASINSFLNDQERSLAFLQRSLALGDGTDAQQTWGTYIAISFNFNALGLYRAALDCQREALQVALKMDRPLLISRSYQYLGLTYGSLKFYDEAIRNVQRAYQEGQQLSSERSGQNMMANASLKLGDLYRVSGDPPRAIRAYDESLLLYDELGFSHYSYVAHKGKFLSYLAEKDDAMASQELPVVLQLFEGHREKILEERQRNLFFDNEQDVYDLAIAFTYSRMGDSRRAFEYSESSRARSLHDMIRNGKRVIESDDGPNLVIPKVAQPLTLSEIQERIPDSVQILQYAVLEDKLLVWYVSKIGFTARTVDINAKTLAEAVASVHRQTTSMDESDNDGATRGLRGLYDILIKPVEGLLEKNKLLCIVPDKSLHYIPFDALISTTSGRYLIQDYRLSTSLSSSVFIDCTEAAQRAGATREERLLAVGNPSFDRRDYPQLQDIAAAEREVEQIAEFYQSARVLVNKQAKASVVRTELERSDVVHFAAHYLIDPRSSLSSKLLLAKEQGNDTQPRGQPDGSLEAREVYRMNLARTRLVVLSACQTGIEHHYGGEGAISYARPFIVAGVPIVVASLWPVDFDATADLMIAFHRHRKQDHLPTVEALRRAQLEMITSENTRYRRPYYWAAFETIGGYAEF
jgi:CHAT domain-containing protein/tetratricopeptide (TPR) repeat protein